ncbi:MAG: hypothetical protein SPI83_03235 [Rothia sp. (in: high G+C Gram-positive bacteria)]|nr:hypothetical protein [Rothia sp. (in: high G+C Gram-positive bacteria)]
MQLGLCWIRRLVNTGAEDVAQLNRAGMERYVKDSVMFIGPAAPPLTYTTKTVLEGSLSP